MDRILNRVYSIVNHPIAHLDVKFRLVYVNGLGASLFSLSDNSDIIRLFFQVWAQSILGSVPLDMRAWRDDSFAVRRAISIRRKGIRLYDFLFDVFYLLLDASPMGFNSSLAKRAYLYFEPLSSNRALKSVYALFMENVPCRRINTVLVEHRRNNEFFLCKKEKKVLIVANVSAGKSTLINALTGFRTRQVKTTVCTSIIQTVFNKYQEDGITYTRDDGSYGYGYAVEEIRSEEYVDSAYHFSSSLSDFPICFIDSPGLNYSEDISHRRLTEAIVKKQSYDLVIYVSNSQFFGTSDEQKTLLFLRDNTSKPIIFVLNQLDRFKQKDESIAKMVNDFRADLIKLGFSVPIVVPLSARAALFLKLPDKGLDEEDGEEKFLFQCQFQKPYFNLASYVHERNDSDVLCRTGIKYLEKQIINLLCK